ncbi:C40 family peptidase [Streptacidiphilus sp. P02-A3a]|uniref:C40 family peptidase n=1 Tax=Streptacidiphilus sp. P02-A3a TaxID=2704468 RepID=UPI0015FAB671|nr:C40 family peptidase [Streptacidiphilus sp. P02-A3a]QMU72439.1 C40 family peptidase [Streptacidiphilus sp. P02-A3a]
MTTATGAVRAERRARTRSGRARLAAAGVLTSALLVAPVPAASAQPRAVCPGLLAARATPVRPGFPAEGARCGADAQARLLGLAVVDVALGAIGTPYAWGGGGEEGPTRGYCDRVNGYLDGVCQADHTVGFDCSGLALYSWYQASDGTVTLPRHSSWQYDRDRHLGPDQLIPGDLLFFAEPGGPIHHVGIYLGGGAMVHAERTGTLVRILGDVFHDPYWGPRYVGAARPAPDAGSPTSPGPADRTAAPPPGWRGAVNRPGAPGRS